MKSRKSKIFNLEKFYLDCIDAEGNCFILYWASLEIYYLKFYYSGLIFSDSKNVTIENYSLKRTPQPLVNELLSIDNPLLQIKGNWLRRDKPILLSLFKDKKNRELIWDCHHPKALAEIEYNNITFKGYGYAETLSLPIKPWNLPIKELKWGRFLSDHYTIIWIQWKGESPLNRIICNGKEYNDATFLVDRVIFNQGCFALLFQDISTLRTGKINNVLAKSHLLKTFVCSRILNGNETKWKAKTVLALNDKIVEDGWSLYEKVTWEK